MNTLSKTFLFVVVPFFTFVANADFVCRLELPDEMNSDGTAVGNIEYENNGQEPLPAPYVRLSAKPGTFLKYGDADGWTSSLELLAVSKKAPASILKPGERRKMAFAFLASGEKAGIECGWTLDSEKPYPWENNGPLMRPSWADDTLWGIAFARLRSGIGESWHDYLVRMRAAADHLFKIGAPECRIDRLWQLEVNEALGVDFALSTLATATDLSRDARGLPLSFSRSYGSSFHQRRHNGILGYGWSGNWDATYSLLPGGDVLEMRSGDGSNARFARIDGKWTPENGFDKTSLEETELEWVFKTKDGMTRRVSKIFGRTTSVSDNQGNALSLSYGDKGRLASVRHVDGQSVSLSYGPDGLLTSATDDQGRSVRYEYEDGMLVRVISWDGLETRYRYLPDDGTAAARALRQIILPDGTTRDFAYDASGRIASVSVNGGRQTVEIVRRPYGSYAVVAPNGAVTEVTVGVSGETVRTKDALGRVSTMAYTADGLLSSIVGPTGKSAAISYDAEGHPVRATGPDGAGTSFAYDPASGSLSSVTDARGNAFRFGSDALGRPNRLSYADDTVETIEYGKRGDVVAAVNRRGQRIACEYDVEGRPVRETWPDGRVLSWAYDARGNCVRAEDSATGAVAMQYDACDRLTRIVHPGGRGFAYAYDKLGRVVSRRTLDSGNEERNEYDALGRLSRMTDGNGSLLLGIDYDETTGWMAAQHFGNGTSTVYDYDLVGRIVRISHRAPDGAELAFFAYEYDAEGRRVSQTTAEGVEHYEYDAAGQLVGVTYPDGTSESFAYDAVGNRVSANGATYVANAMNQYRSIRSADGAETRLDYDADGNLVRKSEPDGSVTEYAYDAANRLVSVKSAAKDIDWSCAYDVFGNRVRTTDHGRTVERLYVQGALPSVAAEYEGDSLAVRHVLAGSLRIADKTATGGRWYHGDGIASARLVTDDSGATSATASYRAFGALRASTGELTESGWVGTLGVERDPTGLVFMRNRYYDPELGRFIQMDPIGLMAGDVNLYRYCGNDPILRQDVDGYQGEVAVVLPYVWKVLLKIGSNQLKKYLKRLAAREIVVVGIAATGVGNAGVSEAAQIVIAVWDAVDLIYTTAITAIEVYNVLNSISVGGTGWSGDNYRKVGKIECLQKQASVGNEDPCKPHQDKLNTINEGLKYLKNNPKAKTWKTSSGEFSKEQLEVLKNIVQEQLNACLKRTNPY